MFIWPILKVLGKFVPATSVNPVRGIQRERLPALEGAVAGSRSDADSSARVVMGGGRESWCGRKRQLASDQSPGEVGGTEWRVGQGWVPFVGQGWVPFVRGTEWQTWEMFLCPSPPHHHCGFLSLPVSASVSDPAQLQFTSLRSSCATRTGTNKSTSSTRQR